MKENLVNTLTLQSHTFKTDRPEKPQTTAVAGMLENPNRTNPITAKIHQILKSDVLTAVLLRIHFFWNVTKCRWVTFRTPLPSSSRVTQSTKDESSLAASA
jgi:hypothetical protein